MGLSGLPAGAYGLENSGAAAILHGVGLAGGLAGKGGHGQENTRLIKADAVQRWRFNLLVISGNDYTLWKPANRPVPGSRSRPRLKK